MLTLGPIGFATPWLLGALAVLPVLWLVLRAVPPAAREVWFPGTALLAGLADRHPVAQRTPWWLLALRCLTLGALILGLAGPVWRPVGAASGGPLLIVLDAGWGAAPGWEQALTRARTALAGAAGRPVGLLIADGRTTGALSFTDATVAEAVLRAARPQPWPSRYPEDPAAALANAPAGIETLWLADGLDHPGRGAWLAALGARGPVRVALPQRPAVSLTLAATDPPGFEVQAAGPMPAPELLALGPDPQGIARILARLPAGPGREAGGGITRWTIAAALPAELRNRVTRFELANTPSAGAVWLADDRTRRRKVGLVQQGGAAEGQTLLSPLHYLRQALTPTADVIEGGLADLVQSAPDVIVLPDAVIPPQDGVVDWVEAGGTLVRFAGPRMAADEGLDRDPLLPLRLRPGGRDIGGALSWGDPRGLAPFAADGPFAGLTPAPDIAVRAQLMAEPGPEVASRVTAALSDATPLVSRAARGAGQVVLFHVTANAEWSDLPLSGLFAQMLGRVVQSARAVATATDGEAAPAPFWTPAVILDGFGREAAAEGDMAPVEDAALTAGPAPGVPAGLYRAGPRERAVNAGVPLVPAAWPGARIEAGPPRGGLPLGAWAIGLAMLALTLDAVLSAALSGSRRRAGA